MDERKEHLSLSQEIVNAEKLEVEANWRNQNFI